jgi:hypothetical protein
LLGKKALMLLLFLVWRVGNRIIFFCRYDFHLAFRPVADYFSSFHVLVSE